MAEQRSSLAPGFTWSAESSRYRHVRSGRYVPPEQVRAALDRVLDGSAGRMRALTARLQSGEISLPDWQRTMAAEVRAAHVAAATSAKGGFAQMSSADYGFVGQRVRTQLSFLQKFSDQIADGRQPLNGTLLARAELYGHAGRMTGRAMEHREGRRRGDTHEKSILGAADHCRGCLTEARRGWQPLGTLVPPGSRECKVRCHCHLATGPDPAEAERAA